eukprot:CAMPEP_0197465406 /NCGR_PEP_ID=MMETSP1175-20131217/64520_1 /TAXON_ID=1003142 /ORGANISM="Triceratium dubium, Strain CCMP147" /LENGTH=906 /DNA_ID=CAMNT_0043001419 /DNA_START=60 /DNA_END=2780 /DNA_ORIENTATION=-
MRLLLVAAVAVALVGFVAAECPNACSGHGDCGNNYDYCQCYDGFTGADCSQRLCAFGLAYIDTPYGDLNHDNVLTGGGADADLVTAPSGVTTGTSLNPEWRKTGWWERHPAALYGAPSQSAVAGLEMFVRTDEGHFYAECSNRGTCDRSSGLCQCFTGYEGTACNRTVCLNDCSGHGTCERLDEIVPSHLHYRLWDNDKTQYCKCDGGYFGQDCSQRACMKHDDPLTTVTSTIDYNNGLTETNEVQLVDIRCPYNGEMLAPSISLMYTDVQFGDVYETTPFDPLVAADALAALKGLPNQVLADFSIDGTTVVNKVVSVSSDTLEIDASTSEPVHIRLTVVFESHLGDVPLLGGRGYFKCRGGLEVDLDQTGTLVDAVKPTWLGEGPDNFVEARLTVVDGTNFNYQLYNAAGQELTSGASANILFATADADFLNGDEAALRAINSDIAEVQFTFAAGADDADDADLTRTAGGIYILRVHVDPTITAKNAMGNLVAAASSPAITVDDNLFSGDQIAVDLVSAALDPTYDVTVKVVGVDATDATDLTRTAGGIYILRVHVDPTITAKNAMGNLVVATSSPDITVDDDQFSGDQIAVALSTAVSNPTYDVTVKVVGVDATDANGFQNVYVNGDLVGQYRVHTAAGNTLDAVVVGPDTTYAHALPTNANIFIHQLTATVGGTVFAAGNYFEFALGKAALTSTVQYTDPVSTTAIANTAVFSTSVTSAAFSAGEGFTLTYFNNVAPSQAISLVFQFVSVSGAPDTYKWKVAGDETWTMDITTPTAPVGWDVHDDAPRFLPSGTATGSDATAGPTSLTEYFTRYPDDPMRAGLARLMFQWQTTDLDSRVCASSSAERSKIYVQIGSVGLNDSPECSGRGICDYGTGICRCFKGYAGIDCHEQNALAGGFGGSA